MRTRLSPAQRRSEILTKANRLFTERGFAQTDMEDIRKACDISRGGLYHYFRNKRDLLDGILENEITTLVHVLDSTTASPILAILQSGSSHLGNVAGVITGLKTQAERLEYLSSLDQAIAKILCDPLAEKLKYHTHPNVNPQHVADLFLTINAHINRRTLLGDWSASEAASFTATALAALLPLLRADAELQNLVSHFKQLGSES